LDKNKRSNQLVVPHAQAAIDRLKSDIALQLGIHFPQDGYYGDMPTRDAGRIGGNITRHLVQIAQQQLAGQYKRNG